MRNSQKGFSTLEPLLVIVVAVLIGLAGWYIWQTPAKEDAKPNNNSGQQYKISPDPQEQAIKQAELYQPQGNCTADMTPAIHAASGARYTFSSGCIPPGWGKEQTSEDLPADLYKKFRCDRKTKEWLSTDIYCHDYELYKQDHSAGKI